MIERFGEVLLLPGNILLQLEQLQLHRLQRDELVFQTWCDRVVSGALTRRARFRCFDLIPGVVDTGDLSRGKLPELHREARIADPDIIDVDDVELDQLLGTVVSVDTGELPIGSNHIALFGDDGAGAESVLILVQGLPAQCDVAVSTTGDVRLEDVEANELRRQLSWTGPSTLPRLCLALATHCFRDGCILDRLAHIQLNQGM